MTSDLTQRAIKLHTGRVPGAQQPAADLSDWLKHQAIDNRRSYNSEVVARLEESRTRQQATKGPSAEQ